MTNTPVTATAPTGAPAKEELQSGRLHIGGTTYLVNVCFGKIPLEDILKNRILSGSSEWAS